MNRSKAPARAATALSVATIVLLASGCSFGGDGKTTAPSTAAPSQAETQEAAKTEQTGAADEDKAAPITDTKTVTASGAGLSFSVPSSWTEISSESVASQDLASLAQELGMAEATLKSQLEMIDLMVVDTPSGNGFTDNINVSSQTYPKSISYDETVLASAVQTFGGTPGEYTEADTALGKAHLMYYTLSLGGKEASGAIIMIPNAKGDLVQTTVTTKEPDTCKALAETVLSSVR